ncbi:MAG: MogA/MoaB family molybdenum cofactor biosynthesis protein [Oscillospiraceae bacterium]|nr:MogA/MoaB family molybdenum cofactor biosynthesis protein [Oscillospiraceae bacterium]
MRYTAAVITVSDKGWRGERKDTSGPAVCAIAAENGFEVVHTAIVPDDREMIQAELIRCADELKISLILTTGGTGFSPRDVTPEATLAVIERETPGIPEAMRWASLQITPRGCLSRSVAGIRGRSLIVGLPGSEKAARENLNAVIQAIAHGMDMLASEGSADCAAADQSARRAPRPSLDAWLREAKQDPASADCGMYLFHNGVVRQTAKARVRAGDEDAPAVRGMRFSYDGERVEQARQAALAMPGIRYARVWLADGELKVGDDIMFVLVGGDIRPHVVDALQALVGEIKTKCVREEELF